MINSERVKTIDEILVNKEEYAKNFSEGNENLERLLLKLWNEGYDTIGCCIGHPEQDSVRVDSSPYVAFKYGNYDNLLKLISSIDKSKVSMINFTVNKYRSCIIKSSRDIRDDFFNEVYNCTNDKEDENFRRIFKYYSSLVLSEDIDDNEFFAIRISYKNGEIDYIDIQVTMDEVINKLANNIKFEVMFEKLHTARVKDFSFLNYLEK